MKIVKSRRMRVFAIAVVMAASIIACGSESPVTTTPSPTVSVQDTPTATPHEIRRSDGGRTFVREDGWAIPSLDLAEKEEFKTSLTTADGRNIQVHGTSFRTADPLSHVTDNPLHSVGIGFEKILLNKVREYRTDAGVFCYKFLVNDAEVDEGTNKVRSTRGYLYAYRIYDEDGDGVFESLIINEKDRNGNRVFESQPHLPEWAITKNQNLPIMSY